jgi:hypothetical protein
MRHRRTHRFSLLTLLAIPLITASLLLATACEQKSNAPPMKNPKATSNDQGKQPARLVRQSSAGGVAPLLPTGSERLPADASAARQVLDPAGCGSLLGARALPELRALPITPLAAGRQ